MRPLTFGEKVAMFIQKFIGWQCSATIPFKDGGYACCVKHKFHFGKHITHEQCGNVEF